MIIIIIIIIIIIMTNDGFLVLRNPSFVLSCSAVQNRSVNNVQKLSISLGSAEKDIHHSDSYFVLFCTRKNPMKMFHRHSNYNSKLDLREE